MCFNLYYKHAFKRDTLPNYSGCIIHAYTLCPVEVHVEINICMYMFVYIVVAALHGHCNYYVDPRRACAARVAVCVSVKSHLTYGASVRPKRCHVLSGQRRSKICGFL